MSRRACLLLVLPLSATGVLVGHDLSYRLAGVDPGSLHDYLRHAPQILVALLLPAALVATAATRGTPRPWLFALLGAGGFTLLEHFERLAHGQTLWLFTSPLYLLGLALQLPFAIGAWWLARALVRLRPPRARRLRLARFTVTAPALVPAAVPRSRPQRPRLRAPPVLPG